MTINATRVAAAAVGSTNLTPTLKVTRVAGVMLGNAPDPHVLVTGISAVVLGNLPAPTQMFTRACVSILASRTPLYTYTDMILTDVFPYDISYNSVGSIRFATDVIVVDSGADQRVSRWAQPLMEYDIAYGVRTMEQLSALIAFFRAMNGRLYTFMYQDHMDYTSSVATSYEARSAPPISATDQSIGTGDGTTTTFQLSKTYSSPSSGTTQVRPILCPNTTTVKVAINGVQVSNWTVNATTGIVTFTIPYQSTISGTVNKGAGSDTYAATLSASAGTFSAFAPYVGYGVAVSGFTNSANNIAANQGGSIYSVSGDGSSMVVQYPGGYGQPAGSASGITLAVTAAPPNGASITAGYQFYVPCRFDTDTLPLTLEDYGIGSAQSIKVVEVRPASF